ncbi:MAG: nucleotidyltransferase substrate binding protein [Selenomonas sp.]|jgi:nucleotidyltransferase substrate binding protein (TIGR01987 family)|nr:nucleotidyltransferase substrate binding protein [Selenomonas sp.]
MKKYDNFCSNLRVLEKASEQDLDNEFIISGIIDKFFVQFELGWKLLKELIKYEGRPVAASGSPRSIIKEAYKMYDFFEADIWLEMLDRRNDLTHIYDGKEANRLAYLIMDRYIPEFLKMERYIAELYGDTINKL